MGIAEARKRNKAARVRAYAGRRRRQFERRTGRLFHKLETELAGKAKPIIEEIAAFAADYRRIQNPGAPLDVDFSPLEAAVEKMLQAAYANGRWSGYRYIRDIAAARNGGKHPPQTVSLSDWPPLTDAAFLAALRAFLDGKPESEWADTVPAGLKAYFGVYSKQIVSKYAKDSQDVIQKIILEAVNSGNTLNEKIDALRVKARGLGLKPQWMIERIARTETTRAYSIGNLQSTMEAAADGSGLIVGFEFSAILDSRVSDICERRHTLKMKIDDPRLPQNTPPLHPNCRSVLIPLFEWDVEEGWESEENREYTWDTVPPSIQREQDVELVRAMLERSGWRAGTAAVGDMAIQPFAAGGIPDKLFEPGLFSGKGDTDGISVITSKELFAVKDSVAVEAALRKFAEETAESAIEKAVVISPDGHKYEIDGRSYVVGIHVVGEEALEGAEVIHNHPGSGADSFSEADFVGFFAYKLKSLEVVYNGKRHRMEWDGERLTEDKAKEVYDRAWQYLEQLAADSRVRMQDDAQYGVMSYLKENLKGLLFYEL